MSIPLAAMVSTTKPGWVRGGARGQGQEHRQRAQEGGERRPALPGVGGIAAPVEGDEPGDAQPDVGGGVADVERVDDPGARRAARWTRASRSTPRRRSRAIRRRALRRARRRPLGRQHRPAHRQVRGVGAQAQRHLAQGWPRPAQGGSPRRPIQRIRCEAAHCSGCARITSLQRSARACSTRCSPSSPSERPGAADRLVDHHPPAPGPVRQDVEADDRRAGQAGQRHDPARQDRRGRPGSAPRTRARPSRPRRRPAAAAPRPRRSSRAARSAGSERYITRIPAWPRLWSIAHASQSSATITVTGTSSSQAGTGVATSQPPRWMPARITPRPSLRRAPGVARRPPS